MTYKKTVLKNGMRIITVALAESQSAIGMVLVEAGSDHEPKELNGLSHFLEHMCFKGTTNRTAEQIRLEIDGMGASSNAFTSNEYTGYYAKAHKSKTAKVVDFVSDLYLNPTFPQKDIDIERGVIVEEINMYEDLPQRTVFDIWYELLYPDQPAGRTVLGPKENILRFSQKDFQAYHAKQYVPAKTVFVVAGNIDQKEVIAQLRKIFSKVEGRKATGHQKARSAQARPQIAIRHKKTDQSHMVVGFRSYDLYSDKNYALKLASVILGQGFSSRLFTKMRDELGLCYYVSANIDTYTDRGMLLIRAGVTNARVFEAVEVLMAEFRKLLKDGIPESELKKAKDYLIGNFSIGLETSEDVADWFGFQELHHEEILKPAQYVRGIQKVTAGDILKVLKEIMKDKALNLALVGPFGDDDRAKLERLLTLKA